MVLDDQKGENYAYQTEFSYRMNQLSRRRWFARNIALGLVLGTLMALILFVMTDKYLSDPARMVVAVVLGIWPTKQLETMAERSTKVAILAMAAAFAVGIVLYAVKLLRAG